MQGLFVALLVLVMMLAVGLKVGPAELWAIRRRPRVLAASLAVNLLVVPALAFALCRLFVLPIEMSVALLLCAAAPGGPMGPLFADRARADLAFAISLMTLLCAVSVATTPLTLSLFAVFLAGADGGADPLALARTLALYQFAPLALGVAMRARRPDWADRLAPSLTRLANGLLVALVLGLLLGKGVQLVSFGAGALVAINLLVALCLVLGWSAARGDAATARGASLITGVRNLAIALLISATHVRDPRTDIAILCFGLFMLCVSGGLAVVWGRRAPA